MCVCVWGREREAHLGTEGLTVGGSNNCHVFPVALLPTFSPPLSPPLSHLLSSWSADLSQLNCADRETPSASLPLPTHTPHTPLQSSTVEFIGVNH